MLYFTLSALKFCLWNVDPCGFFPFNIGCCGNILIFYSPMTEVSG